MEYKYADHHYYFPKFLGNYNLQISVSTQTIPETLCFPYYSSQTDHIEKDALATLMTLLPEFNGRIFGHNAKGKDSLFCYELMLEFSVLTSTQIELITQYNNNSHILPVFTSMLATTITNNYYDSIIDAWNYLYNTWMQHSMFEQSDLPFFEEYLSKQGTHPKLMLYLPIKKQTISYIIQIQDMKNFTILISSKTDAHKEEEASIEVVEFLQLHYPYLLKRCKTMFTRQFSSNYSCGILLEAPITIPTDSMVALETISGGRYASITLSQCCDPTVIQPILTSWLFENGFKADEDVSFCLYNIHPGLSGESFDTTYYIKLVSDFIPSSKNML